MIRVCLDTCVIIDMKKMISERRKTLRTIRLTRELDNILQQEAQARRISVNTLINATLTKYAEWDRHIEKFGFISIAGETFKAFLSEVDDQEVEKIGGELGNNMPRAITFF
nr:hypothetical protein [Candidatus Njordarchaeum guaymaensis]